MYKKYKVTRVYEVREEFIIFAKTPEAAEQEASNLTTMYMSESDKYFIKSIVEVDDGTSNQ